jgi:Cys-tRNA(Pro)/Cys-tRNA(Cys) deacylase
MKETLVPAWHCAKGWGPSPTVKTNAIRILESLKIPHETREYEVDPEDLAAATVATKVGMPLSHVYKTLLCRSDKGTPMFAVIAGDRELDLKMLARASGSRSVSMVSLKEVQPLTGYVRGGVTVLGAKKALSAYLDQSAMSLSLFSVSAGLRGLQILLCPADYVRATAAELVTGLGRATELSED